MERGGNYYGSYESDERDDLEWMEAAAGACETLYPGLLQELSTLRPEGDRAVVRGIYDIAEYEYATDADIARLLMLGKFDARAGDEIGRLIEEGMCTEGDVTAVFFALAERNLF
jgi:hypothetical protein